MKADNCQSLIGLTVESSVAKIQAQCGEYVLKPLLAGDTNNNSGQGLVFGGKAHKSVGRVVKAVTRQDGVIELYHAPFACAVSDTDC